MTWKSTWLSGDENWKTYIIFIIEGEIERINKNKHPKNLDHKIFISEIGFEIKRSIVPDWNSSLNDLITMIGIKTINIHGVMVKNSLKSMKLFWKKL